MRAEEEDADENGGANDSLMKAEPEEGCLEFRQRPEFLPPRPPQPSARGVSKVSGWIRVSLASVAERGPHGQSSKNASVLRFTLISLHAA